jgi:16S rRNA U516 pseudouridylate synthase RsuA-like enzyme
MGPLILDEKLAPGQWRPLTEEEIKALEGQGHES